MPDEKINFSEILVSPIESMITKVAQGVANAQRSMDESFYDGLLNPDKDSELTKIGYQPSWYQMSEIEVDLKLAVHIEKKTQNKSSKLYFTPYNAKYKNAFIFDAEGSSSIKMKIVPIPPSVFNVPEEK